MKFSIHISAKTINKHFHTALGYLHRSLTPSSHPPQLFLTDTYHLHTPHRSSILSKHHFSITTCLLALPNRSLAPCTSSQAPSPRYPSGGGIYGSPIPPLLGGRGRGRRGRDHTGQGGAVLLLKVIPKGECGTSSLACASQGGVGLILVHKGVFRLWE